MINFGLISFDILLILIVTVILFIVAFRSGKKPLITLTISTYPALLITEYLPWISFEDLTAKAVIFVLVYILSIVVLWKNVHVRKVHSNSRKIIDYGLISIMYMVLVLSIWFTETFSLQVFHSFEPQIVSFITKIPFGLVLILPLIILILTNRNERI